MFKLELEIEKEQMEILYDFAKNTNLADLHDRFGDKFCSDDLYAIDMYY